MRTDRHVTQPSIFSNSPMSTTTTSKPQSSNSSADRGADAATIAELKGRHMLVDTYAELFDAVPSVVG